MKKLCGGILLVLSLAAGVLMWIRISGGIRYNSCLTDEAAFYALQETREPDPELLEAIRFDGQTLVYDASADTFYYSLIEDSATAYNPYIQLQTSERAQIAILSDEISGETIASNQAAQMIVYTDTSYYCYHLICTTLPLMNLVCSGEIGMDEDADVTMELYDNRAQATARVFTSDGKIHVRGATTSTFPKKGYRISLTTESTGGNTRGNDVSLLGMRQDDDWILYACYNDQEKVRNVFSSNLWKVSCAEDNSLGIDAGMEYRYLELFLNGEYWGLYALGYPVDSLQMQIGDDAQESSLYKKYVWAEDDSVSYASYYWNKSGQDTPSWDLMQEYFLNYEEHTDDSAVLLQGIDIDNAINLSLFINLVQGTDQESGGVIDYRDASETKNLYLALYRTDDGVIGLWVPWDLDYTWGNVWGAVENYTMQYEVGPEYNHPLQCGYLYQIVQNRDTDTETAIYEKYRELRNGAWSEEALNQMLDELEAQIYGSGAFCRDMERWEEGAYADPEDGLNIFRAFVMGRLEAMDSYYTSPQQN